MSEQVLQTDDFLERIKKLHANKGKPHQSYKDVAISYIRGDTDSTPDSPTDNQLQVISATPTQIIDFELWETLAYDLALGQADDQTIATAYSITVDQLNDLKTHEHFSRLLASKKEEVAQLGTDASFAVKMRVIANKATPQFLKRLLADSTNSRDFHIMFKTAVELAKLTPEEGDNQQINAGTTVTFNIQGVPGLEHLSTVSITPKTSNIVDAEFSEVDSKGFNYTHDELEEL